MSRKKVLCISEECYAKQWNTTLTLNSSTTLLMVNRLTLIAAVSMSADVRKVTVYD